MGSPPHPPEGEGPTHSAQLNSAELSGTEAAVLQVASVSEARDLLDRYVIARLGSPIDRVLFRAGRIDAVWGVVLGDGREVVVKSHRQPADLGAIATAREAQRTLSEAGFPCPVPLSGPDEVEGRVLSLETYVGGGVTPDGRRLEDRRLLAAGLARHVELLRGRPNLRERAARGPSWCRYQDGPWPTPHDPIVDFQITPPGHAWLDDFGAAAADQVLTSRSEADVVVGHADWYAGNTTVADGVLVATFDWELVADSEAVIAGFTAACFAASSTSGAGLSTPEEVAGFLHEYDVQRGVGMTGAEQRAAAGAATWILAFNARWELGMQAPGQPDGTTLTLVRERRADYLAVSW